MLRIIVCGDRGSGISTLVERLSGDKLHLEEARPPGAGTTSGELGALALSASAADLALLVVDAGRVGVDGDWGADLGDHIHGRMLALSVLGIGRAVLAVNKIDLAAKPQQAFESFSRAFCEQAAALGLDNPVAVPVSALNGDVMDENSRRPPWYDGASLAAILSAADGEPGPFRFPVLGAEGGELHGAVSGSPIKTGDPVVVLPGAATGVVASISRDGEAVASAMAGSSVVLTIDGLPDVAAGDMLCAASDRALMSDQFKTRLIWLHDDPLLPSRPYALCTANRTVPVSITELRYIINPRSLDHEAGTTLNRDQIGVCNLALAEAIAFDPIAVSRTTGGFTIIDATSGDLVAAGAIEFGLYRADNIHWQSLSVDKGARARMKGQRPAVLWFTGLSGSGKSTIANRVEQKLHAIGRHTYTLDGDNVRHGLNKNLGFTDADRVENIRRVAEVSKLMTDAGLICMVSFISPFRAERQMARDLMEDGEFIEVFVNTPFELCEQRDPKGLYKKARAGEIKNFTGFDSPYDEPENPELDIPTATQSAEQAADDIIAYLREKGFIEA